MARLIHIESSRGLRLEIAGPVESRRRTLAAPDSPLGFLRVVAESPTVTWVDSSGAQVPQLGDLGPRLFEETGYRLIAESRDGRPVRVVGTGPGALSNAEPVDGHPNLILADLNFRSTVGFATFRVEASDGEAVEATVQVFPTKLDFRADYLEMVSEVSALARGLVFRYTGTTYGLASPTTVDTASALEWAVLLRAYLSRLEAALGYVARRPHRQLERREEYIEVGRIRRPSPTTFQAIRQRRGRGTTLLLLGMPVRQLLPVAASRETLDTPENRWLRAALVDVRRRLVEIRRESAAWRERQASAGRNTGRLDSEIAELDTTERSVSRLLQLEPLREALSQPPPGFSSLALMSRPGYREAYRALSVLRMSLGLDTGEIQVPLAKLSTLYEYWCYLRVAAALVDTGSTVADLRGFVRVDRRGLAVTLSRDAASTIVLTRGRQRQLVRYGTTFGGLTGLQQPDIIVEVDLEGWPALIVVLDAKYRVDASGEIKDGFGGAAPPIDAVNALHRYRDAIVQKEGGRISRPVVKGVALFPLSAADSVGYKSRPLYTSLRSLGVGALPFVPNNTEIALEWVQGTLAAHPRALSSGLAPQAADSERWRREVEQLTPVLMLAPPDVSTWETLLAQTVIPVPDGAKESIARLVGVVMISPPAGGRVMVHEAAIAGWSEAARTVTPGTWNARGSLAMDSVLPDWGLVTSLAVRLATVVSDLGLGSALSHELAELQPVLAPAITTLQRDGQGWLSAEMVTGYPVSRFLIVGHRTARKTGTEWLEVLSIEEATEAVAVA